ncbi:50S ribosomal protein L31 [Candidatus Pantoea edessiphila]|uniref:Large ribosomal subunit protein bL31 n=1 Tax=Candidatus Pantoea edessiphila TaxID=2044610 RepID=A0A2P5T280_9GAMM|nr:50S ribosomal protein L31 [Candidatus Pantoea edessiphila]PPI88701.1 50S ribosomal protein L31 [Candidatus Pantoea edessiphila]
MKKNVHPNYEIITVNCTCGNEITVRSTLKNKLNLDVCSQCHPFYTGKQRDVSSGGRIDRFNKRFSLIDKE